MPKSINKSEISGIEGLVSALCRTRDPEKMKQLLQEILTPAEFHDLAMRWELMQRLDQGQTQRQIASELGISLCKITRGAKILKKDGSITKQFIQSGRRK